MTPAEIRMLAEGIFVLEHFEKGTLAALMQRHDTSSQFNLFGNIKWLGAHREGY